MFLSHVVFWRFHFPVWIILLMAFGLDRQSITRDVWYTKRKRLFNILLPFSLLIPGTPYIRSSEILSKYLVASSKHFGLPPNYALGSSSSNHPQRTIESPMLRLILLLIILIFVDQTNHPDWLRAWFLVFIHLIIFINGIN
jgi:hypothetical protein